MTMYAILTADQITATGTARELWPDTSHPSTGPAADWLAERNAARVRSDLPHDPQTHYLRRVAPYLLDGEVFNMEAVERPPVEPAPPEPRWQEFAAALVLHPEVGPMVEAFLDALALNKKTLVGMIYVGLGQAAQGDGQTFSNAWTLATMQGFVAPELAAAVAALAVHYDLPAEFVGALNPQPEPELEPEP